MSMTENESKYGNIAIIGGGRGSGRTLKAHLDILQELEAYRAIGTVRQVQDFITDWRQFRELGNLEEFKALKEKNEPKKIEFMHNRSDIVSVWKCHCGNVFLTKHKEGILDGTDVNYCCKCGQKIDWGDDNE